MTEDLGIADKLLSRFNALLSNFLAVSSSLKNWYVLLPLYLNLGSHVLESASGRRTRVGSWKEFLAYWNSSPTILERIGDRIRLSVGADRIIVRYRDKNLDFLFDDENTRRNILFEINEHFVGEEYGSLDAAKRTIVDIGAGMGETALFFLARGATHVYAFEPMPFAYDLAKRNMRENRVANKVTLVNEGVGDYPTVLRVNAKLRSTPGSSPRPSSRGKRVRIRTLAQIVSKYGISKAVLKVDCEGCEYGAILGADTKTLRAFDQIIIEYHHGYRQLARKLKEARFSTNASLPEYFVYRPESKRMYMGLLFASKQ